MDIVEEFAGAELGDRRLTRRLPEIARRLAANPSKSFPAAMKTEAALEATYRFLNNSSVEPTRILAPHLETTLQRCFQHERVVVAHDTTTMHFSTPRKGLGRLSEQQAEQGFFLHTALALAGDGSRDPLGVIGANTFIRTGKPSRKKTRHSEKKPEPQRESFRWWQMLANVEEQLDDKTTAVHVMDREADNYLLFARALEQEMRFVIRSRFNRPIAPDGNERVSALKDALIGLDGKNTRSVYLSPRFPRCARNAKKRSRQAKLEMCATRVEILAPKTPVSTRKKLPASIELNLVHVFEIDPPLGFEPVDWKLLTTESVGTPEEIADVVDTYAARWVIEEYFKALKTGCAMPKRQLETAPAIYNALAVMMPIAWFLLRLRQRSRTDPEEPADTVMDALHIRILQAHADVRLASDPTVEQAWLAVARLGGHLKRNGPPGWQVLGRGFLELLTLAYGAHLAVGGDL